MNRDDLKKLKKDRKKISELREEGLSLFTIAEKTQLTYKEVLEAEKGILGGYKSIEDFELMGLSPEESIKAFNKQMDNSQKKAKG